MDVFVLHLFHYTVVQYIFVALVAGLIGEMLAQAGWDTYGYYKPPPRRLGDPERSGNEYGFWPLLMVIIGVASLIVSRAAMLPNSRNKPDAMLLTLAVIVIIGLVARVVIGSHNNTSDGEHS